MDREQLKLGGYLRSLREVNSMTLRAVEKKTGISNAMLSQLESGKVKRPSPIFLHKLAKLYGIPYETLMEKAGYPVPKPAKANVPKMKRPFHRLGPLTSEEEEDLLEYLLFIRSRSEKGRGKP